MNYIEYSVRKKDLSNFSKIVFKFILFSLYNIKFSHFFIKFKYTNSIKEKKKNNKKNTRTCKVQ